jgi:capsular exopolysaccharide synthesis family protein
MDKRLLSTHLVPAGELDRHHVPFVAHSPPQTSESIESDSMLEVLWQQRRTLVGTTMLCLIGAAVYLLLATPIYRSVAEVYIEPTPPKVLQENQNPLLASEGFLNAQASSMESTPVLSSALNAVNYRNLETFAHVNGDPVVWLRAGNGFDVEAVKRSDTLLVSMESPYPRETAALVNAVVDAYIADRSIQEQSIGDKMLGILRKQKQDIADQRTANLLAMLKLKQDNGAPSLMADKNNDVLERLTSLATKLDSSELDVIDLQARQQSARGILKDPASIASFVQSQQSQSQDPGDTEYRELRSLLTRTTLSIPTESSVLDENNPRLKTLRVYKAKLEEQLRDKERAIAEANLADITRKLADAQQKTAQLRTDLEQARQQVMNRSPASAQYGNLEVEQARLDQMNTLVTERMGQVSANAVDSGSINVRIVDSAREAQKPIKPHKSLVLAVGLLTGLLLGSGLSLAREWRDARLSSPTEVQNLLRIPVIAVVPRINSRLSSVARGQLVHLDARSPAAEAYRSIRTLLQLGAAREARTILLASPMPGDGKSTTASNLAIAFAQSGCNTLLIDCDLRNPVQHMVFGLDGDCGLTSVIAGERKIGDAIRPTQIPGLYVLPCGPFPLSPSELLASAQFNQLMQNLTNMFDRIILDSSPLCSVTDARILAASSDATLLVLRMNQSMRAFGVEAMSGLEMVGARVVGAIANGVSYGAQTYGYPSRSWQYASSGVPLPMPAEYSPVNGGVRTATSSTTALTPWDSKELRA